MQEQERRTEGIARVPIETIVELCGRDGEVPPFEAASVEVSGRGMHVRADYLPEVGAPLVVRFELGGEEVTAEGEVAWTNPTPEGGEFGICFTALDSPSVLALKRLARGEIAVPDRSNLSHEQVANGRRPSFEIPEGAPVRLHLQGLGAPMKARVFRQGMHRLHVGSDLEFLTVGKPIELQPGEGEDRRTAEIDSVSVVIDPQSQIPQLVVSLRVAGATDRTPDPSLVDRTDSTRAEPEESRVGRESNQQELNESMSDQLDAWVVRLGDWTKRRAERCAVGSRRAIGALARTTQAFAESRRRFSRDLGAGASHRRRTTSPARVSSAQRYTLRRQQAASEASQGRHEGSKAQQPREGGPGRSKQRSALAAGALTLGALMCWGMLGPGADGPAVGLQANKSHAALPAPMAPLTPAAASVEQLASSGTTAAAVRPADAVSTLDPLPRVDEPSRPSTLKRTKPEDEFGVADDETFTDRPGSARPQTATSEVSAWGRGRLHLPIVHKIRLDKPATALEGVETATGFRVLLAGRKLLENGRAIEKRDDRITQVVTKNDPEGARIEFRFQSSIPPYKVRVKDSAVEFFISADY